MSVEIVRNPSEAEGPLEPTMHEDGSWYPFAMQYDGAKWVAFADTYEDLMEVLSPGYQALTDPNDRLAARIRLALDVQVAVQAQINATVSDEVWDSTQQWERDILEGERTEQPHGWGEDDPAGDVWSSPIPLVLVDTGYAPYTDINQPLPEAGQYSNDADSNLLWLRPVHEDEFLLSLNQVGYITLATADAVNFDQGDEDDFSPEDAGALMG